MDFFKTWMIENHIVILHANSKLVMIGFFCVRVWKTQKISRKNVKT